MASCAIISWQLEGENVEAVTDFLFLGSKITVDGDCSHEIKRCLLLRTKAMTNLDSTLKSRGIIFPTTGLFASGGQGIGALASASVLPMNIQGSFPLGLTGLISFLSKGLSRVFSNTTVQKH